MDDRIYDYWVATLQDGYIGNLIDIVDRAGGAKTFYNMTKPQLRDFLHLSDKLSDYIIENRADPDIIEEQYHKMYMHDISYVNHTDSDFPQKLRDIPSSPYGIFVKGQLPNPDKPAVAIVGARECSEYGRLMAEFLGSRLAKENIQIISGMAWGIDGIAQASAIDAGGKSFAVLGCGVDRPYPSKNRSLYNRLCAGGNGVISEYAPGTRAIARLFPPRNRIISGLSDVLIVVEARQRSGTLITVDLAIDQGKIVMVVPGRLTDNLSTGCLNILAQGALPVTGIKSILEQLGKEEPALLSKPSQNRLPHRIRYSEPVRSINQNASENGNIPEELQIIANILTLDPQSAETIASRSGIPLSTAMIILTKLELEGHAKEVWPGYFTKRIII